MNILFLGDSITDCDHNFTGDNLGNGYVKKLSLLPCVTAVNGGTDGFTFPDVLRKWRLMYARNPYDRIVMTCGINDAGLIADLTEACRQEDASAFLEESMAALQAFLKESVTALQMFPDETSDTNCAQASSLFSHILLLEPFLFPIPQARKRWFPILRKVRKRIRKTIDSFNAGQIPFPEAAQHYAPTAPCVRYVPTQAALDSLAGQIGLPAVTTDGIHLTDEGHACLAELIVNALHLI